MVGPILSQTLPDIFCDNEYSPNFLFRNNGDGTFTDVAVQAGELNKRKICLTITPICAHSKTMHNNLNFTAITAYILATRS